MHSSSTSGQEISGDTFKILWDLSKAYSNKHYLQDQHTFLKLCSDDW